MKKLSVLLGIALLVLMAFGNAQATLYDRGGGLIYDSYLDITWLSDANYADTTGYDDLIYGGDTGGLMAWDYAMAWATNLSYGGFQNWRLPSALNPDGSGPCNGFNCPDSEMGHLFYVDLGLTAWQHISDATDPDINLFSGLHDYLYWTKDLRFPEPGGAVWVMDFWDGQQTAATTNTWSYAWAVHDGDVGPIPEPATCLLVGSGLIGLAGLRRLWRGFPWFSHLYANS
ncbi:MAG: PEP-CTERM sorting domain-containing protein [Deltaproteobacteria bacterium]|nr:PEP-CTERM sorting domain-containing protein [Deltaproteobacteria bacterium]